MWSAAAAATAFKRGKAAPAGAALQGGAIRDERQSGKVKCTANGRLEGGVGRGECRSAQACLRFRKRRPRAPHSKSAPSVTKAKAAPAGAALQIGTFHWHTGGDRLLSPSWRLGGYGLLVPPPRSLRPYGSTSA